MSWLSILQHTMGLDQYGRGAKYRNHFVSCKGHHDQPEIDEMVSEGLMAQTNGIHPALLGGEDSYCFHVTASGERFIEKNSPKPPRLTKAQQRGERWREYGDMFNSFRDFLRWDCSKDRTWNGGMS